MDGTRFGGRNLASFQGLIRQSLKGRNPTLHAIGGASDSLSSGESLTIDLLGRQAGRSPGADDVIERVWRAHRDKMAPQFVAGEARPQ